jgi:hypothetical protein
MGQDMLWLFICCCSCGECGIWMHQACPTPCCALLPAFVCRMTSDPLLSSLTHVVVDEVHERTTQGDFLLALLRRVLAARNTHNAKAKGGGSSGGPGVLPPLKVVLMSATLDAGLYSKYFGGVPGETCTARSSCCLNLVCDPGDALCTVPSCSWRAVAAMRAGGHV